MKDPPPPGHHPHKNTYTFTTPRFVTHPFSLNSPEFLDLKKIIPFPSDKMFLRIIEAKKQIVIDLHLSMFFTSEDEIYFFSVVIASNYRITACG